MDPRTFALAILRPSETVHALSMYGRYRHTQRSLLAGLVVWYAIFVWLFFLYGGDKRKANYYYCMDQQVTDETHHDGFTKGPSSPSSHIADYVLSKGHRLCRFQCKSTTLCTRVMSIRQKRQTGPLFASTPLTELQAAN